MGILIKDDNGHPEYLGGRIRNHAHYSYTDVLTGLRNQYGFFEDVLNNIQNKKQAPTLSKRASVTHHKQTKNVKSHPPRKDKT